MSLASLEVRLRFSPREQHTVGTLALIDREIGFQFDEAFLALGLSLSPFHLPLRRGLQIFDRKNNMDIFGVFEDAMPDSWGRRLIDRHFEKVHGRAPAILERLACVGERGMGALTFHPPEHEKIVLDKGLKLADLATQAWDFDSDKVADALPQLRQLGGTSGGARPKVLLGFHGRSSSSKKILPGDGDLPDGYEHWIVKFNSRADGKDAGPLEFAYAEMAATAGADVPEHRLIDTAKGRFFATRRFDRPGPDMRIHLHSAAGLMHADFRIPGTEYETLFRRLDNLTQDYSQKLELFRRACLNVLACNRDDHLKNFAFLMSADGQWRLAPFYDFTFHRGPNGWQTLSVAGEGEHPRRKHLLLLADRINLRPSDARNVLEQVRSAVSELPKIAKSLTLSRTVIKKIDSALHAVDL